LCLCPPDKACGVSTHGFAVQRLGNLPVGFGFAQVQLIPVMLPQGLVINANQAGNGLVRQA
jgi:hypothetical protein